MTLDLKDTWIEGLKKYGYPCANFRWCTQLKINAINKETINSMVAVGIAYDESERMFTDGTKVRTFVFPLVEMGMTERDCLDYCKSLGFTFYGLYDIRDRVSCYACPLVSRNEILNMPSELITKIEEFESICHKYKHQRDKVYYPESFKEKQERLRNKYKK